MDQAQSEALKEIARMGLHESWCRLAVAVIREVFSKEAKELATILDSVGLRPVDRTPFYDAMRARRESLEAQLFAPGAYERYRAIAREMGLLTTEKI